MAELREPLNTASGAATAAPLVLIDVSAENDRTGHAYIFTYRSDVLQAVTALINDLARHLVGQPITPRAAIGRLRRDFLLLGTPGLVDMALAGLDVALWDLHARTADAPLVRLLGGEPTAIKAYASYGMDGVDRAADAAAEAMAAGFTAIKLKIGYKTLGDDLAVIHAVRKVVGPTVDVMVDYNQSLTVPEAMRRCHALDDENLAWIEEPVRYDDLNGHARIAEATATPLQLGENSWGPAGTLALLTHRACDLVMLDLVKVGGISGWLNAAAVCEVFSAPVSNHFNQETSAHLIALTDRPHCLEFYGLADAVIETPLQAVDGYVTPCETPGNGIEWDEDAVARFAYRG
jgi:mandelate racemase